MSNTTNTNKIILLAINKIKDEKHVELFSEQDTK